MPKPNTYVLLKNAEREILYLRAEVHRMKGFTLQQSLDMALIALHNEFGFGPDRCAKFENAFRSTFMEYAEMCVSDAEDDVEISFTKEKVDRALRAACGDGILPFDERYAPGNLYLRTRASEEPNGKP